MRLQHGVHFVQDSVCLMYGLEGLIQWKYSLLTEDISKVLIIPLIPREVFLYGLKVNISLIIDLITVIG